MTVTENLDMGAYTRKDKAEMAQDFERVFGLFPRLKERHKQVAGTMSGGEQQMLAIGRALMARPRLLCLDEPSMGLAPKLIQQIFDIITEISSQGTTILVVEQNAKQALSRAHRGYVLETGKIVKTGNGQRPARRPQHPRGLPRRRLTRSRRQPVALSAGRRPRPRAAGRRAAPVAGRRPGSPGSGAAAGRPRPGAARRPR